MVVSFNELGPESKIWIYQSDQVLDQSQQEFILKNTQEFLREWTAHGNDLEAGVKILYDQFIIIGVNESYNEASGCSIDKSVAYIRELGKALNIDLLGHSKVSFKYGNQVRMISFTDIKKFVDSGQIAPETEVFNHAVTIKKDLDGDWLMPAENSWIKRYFTIQK